MLETIWEFLQLIERKIQVHKTGDESQLRYEAVANKIEWHVEILQAVKASFFEIDLFDLIMSNINLLYSRKFSQFL